jgi:hypothetical protein
MKRFVERFMVDPKPQIEHFEGQEPLFDQFKIEGQIDAMLGRKVWLKSGGYLIIDQSEALTAIDVNTGRYVGKRDLEETVLKTNLEAVKEVVYQLRLRNIGGLIIIDLIDMESLENREKVYRALQESVRYDKARTNILKISELGLVEMTRKRTRENLVQTLCEPCAHCDGRGYVLDGESVAYKVLRQVRKDLPRFCGRHVALSVNRRVAEHLLGPEREALRALEQDLAREIEIRARADLHQEQFELVALDEGPPVELDLAWLRPGEASPEPAAEAAESAAEAPPEAEESKTAADVAPKAEEPESTAEATLGAEEPESTVEATPEAEEPESTVEAAAETGEAESTAEVAPETESAAQAAPETEPPQAAEGGPAPEPPAEALAAREAGDGADEKPRASAPALAQAAPQETHAAAEHPPGEEAAESPTVAQPVDVEEEYRILPSSADPEES